MKKRCCIVVFQPSDVFHIETVISFALEIMPGFYIECYTGLELVKREYSLLQILNLSLPKWFKGSLLTRFKNSSKNFKPFWKLHFERGSVIHPQHSMSMVLSTRFHIWLLWHFITKCDRYYHKMRQIFYYKMRQKFITKWVRFFILKCNIFITKCDSYY